MFYLLRHYSDLRVISQVVNHEFKLLVWVVLLIRNSLITECECLQNRDGLSEHLEMSLYLLPVLAFRCHICEELWWELLQSF